MPNQTTKPYEQVLVAMADIAPDSPELPWTTTKQPTAPRTPLFAAATAFAAVLLIIGVTTLVLTGRGDAPTNVQAPGATSQTTPPTTGVLSGGLTDSEAAMIWRDAVDRALDEAGWSNRVTFASSSIMPLADGGNVVASIRNDAGELLLVVAFRGFRPGEYSTDPTWQRTLTGTDEPRRRHILRTGILGVPVGHGHHRKGRPHHQSGGRSTGRRTNRPEIDAHNGSLPHPGHIGHNNSDRWRTGKRVHDNHRVPDCRARPAVGAANARY